MLSQDKSGDRGKSGTRRGSGETTKSMKSTVKTEKVTRGIDDVDELDGNWFY